MVRADELYAEVSQDPSGKTPSQVRMSRMAFFDTLIALQSQARPSNLLLSSCPLYPVHHPARSPSTKYVYTQLLFVYGIRITISGVYTAIGIPYSPSQGLFIGCFIDTSTGIISFTCEGKETRQKFRMEPGMKLFPAVFVKATSKDALQYELGRTSTRDADGQSATELLIGLST